MPGRDVVTGQRVRRIKREAARNLRKRMTPEEVLLWSRLRKLRASGLHFRRQQVISGFIVDFYSNVLGMVIEVDGGVHRGMEEADRARDRILRERGLVVLHFTNEEVRREPERVLGDILQAGGRMQPRTILAKQEVRE